MEAQAQDEVAVIGTNLLTLKVSILLWLHLIFKPGSSYMCCTTTVRCVAEGVNELAATVQSF